MTMMEELTLITCGQSFKKKITSLNVKIKFYGCCNIFRGDHIKKFKIDKNQTWIKCSGQGLLATNLCSATFEAYLSFIVLLNYLLLFQFQRSFIIIEYKINLVGQ